MDLTGEIDVLNEELLLINYAGPTTNNREDLFEKYKDKLHINKDLNRALISFQSNKNEPFYRWFKYKEGFSSAFVSKMLELFGKPYTGQTVLDPFAGIGTTITTSIKQGFNAIGIELLSPGIYATNARIAAHKININDLNRIILKIENLSFDDTSIPQEYFFRHLTITKGAFSPETEIAIANYLYFVDQNCKNNELKSILNFAVSSILEDVSFTRKDGQYLRWDYRSERKLKSKFDKGRVYNFKPRLLDKLKIIQEDINSLKSVNGLNDYKLIQGSCLNKLHEVENESIDLIITSPPYCNRYDYTRTYALELAFDRIDDKKIKELRQTLLSATVENKSKFAELKQIYANLGKKADFDIVLKSNQNQLALKEVIRNLYFHKKELNNKNIPNMVKNYFFEMSFVIKEMSRVLKPNGKIIMVNDNVRYNGDEIPVDLILSEFAEDFGLQTDKIWVLERGKGNSSQQMGNHGRKELRKCVYVWAK